MKSDHTGGRTVSRNFLRSTNSYKYNIIFKIFIIKNINYNKEHMINKIKSWFKHLIKYKKNKIK